MSVVINTRIIRTNPVSETIGNGAIITTEGLNSKVLLKNCEIIGDPPGAGPTSAIACDGPIGQGRFYFSDVKTNFVNGGGTAAISGMNFTVSGSSECENGKLYYTGTSSTFATSEQLGATVADVSGAVEFDFTEKAYTTVSGPYYFWLTVDVKSSGSLTEGTTFDAVYTGSDYSGNAPAPTPTDPSGFRISGNSYEIGSGGTFDHFAT